MHSRDQTHNEAANLNEAHHKPQGDASYNPDESVTNKHVQGRFIPPKVGNMPMQPQQQQQLSSEEGSKENTILNADLDTKKQMECSEIILQAQQTVCHKNQPLQHLQIHSQTGGPPQAPPVNNQNRDHQDPLECNGTTSGPTRAPAGSGKGPGPSKGKYKTSEPHPGMSSGTGSTTQPAGHTIVCSACGKSGHWSKNCLYYNFCDT